MKFTGGAPSFLMLIGSGEPVSGGAYPLSTVDIAVLAAIVYLASRLWRAMTAAPRAVSARKAK